MAGIGYETVRGLLRRGPELVVMACRNTARAEAARAQLVKELGAEREARGEASGIPHDLERRVRVEQVLFLYFILSPESHQLLQIARNQ